MSENGEAVKQNPKGKKKRKPLRRAQRWTRETPNMALKLLLLMLGVMVMGLMFSALQAMDIAWLRVMLTLTIALGMLLICWNEGLSKGVRDAGASRLYEETLKKAAAAGAKEDAACYHPMKPVLAALMVFSVPLALAAYIALTTQGYSYTLQDLPLWLTDNYGARADVMAPLGAYTAGGPAMTAADWIRMLVRLPVMIYINLFSDPLVMGRAVDQLTPLFLLTYPAAYTAGYLTAPKAQLRSEKMNRRAKKVAVRKAQKKSLVDELVGDQHGVHYGKQPDSAKHKKKELV